MGGGAKLFFWRRNFFSWGQTFLLAKLLLWGHNFLGGQIFVFLWNCFNGRKNQHMNTHMHAEWYDRSYLFECTFRCRAFQRYQHQFWRNRGSTAGPLTFKYPQYDPDTFKQVLHYVYTGQVILENEYMIIQSNLKFIYFIMFMEEENMN